MPSSTAKGVFANREVMVRARLGARSTSRSGNLLERQQHAVRLPAEAHEVQPRVPAARHGPTLTRRPHLGSRPGFQSRRPPALRCHRRQRATPRTAAHCHGPSLKVDGKVKPLRIHALMDDASRGLTIRSVKALGVMEFRWANEQRLDLRSSRPLAGCQTLRPLSLGWRNH